VAVRSKACLFGRTLAEIAGSNPAEKYAYISVVRVNYQLDANICLFQLDKPNARYNHPKFLLCLLCVV
jgi:hypothetical protein